MYIMTKHMFKIIYCKQPFEVIHLLYSGEICVTNISSTEKSYKFLKYAINFMNYVFNDPVKY